VLAYICWHRPAPDVQGAEYEHALERFHRSLAHRRPSGFRGSAAFRVQGLPWLTSPQEQSRGSSEGRSCAAADYEDWYLIDGWASLGVLEEAAVSRGHITSHDALVVKTDFAIGAVYSLCEGHAQLGRVRLSTWVSAAPGHSSPQIGEFLGDGMDRESAGLWRRCLGLGPAPEYCLLGGEPSAGIGRDRLPLGWTAMVSNRDAIWNG
jgi:hypothetical protein